MNAKSTNTSKAWADPDDAPELTDGFFEQGVWQVGDKPVSRPEAQQEAVRRRGRPAGTGGKISTTIRFDADILEAFKATGDGWQTRMNDALKEWLRSRQA
ncbi:BrnA antitoxin family protein [Janthinobacterium sp. SUN100]|uniref:BrnA antitoxin family protein n=1 Tax=Janthinobacterium sp. SUN100 TaxID=3004101 RepID=UPI0025AEDB0B|nr:BrnA antitoxin family protein [Janthinobacterium sp. SUN100]MDN2703515.1 BrnA antitoxin family protein [Janthinobacterium sp. SUN100]